MQFHHFASLLYTEFGNLKKKIGIESFISNMAWTALYPLGNKLSTPANNWNKLCTKNGKIYLKIALDALLVVWGEGLRLSSWHVVVTQVIKN
jgi:hypothetical protein